MSRIRGRVMKLEQKRPPGTRYIFSPIPTNGMRGQELLDAIERAQSRVLTAEEWEARNSPHRRKDDGMQFVTIYERKPT